jgi:hypothetical protein
MDLGRIRDSIDCRTEEFTSPENFLLIRLQGWRVMLKSLGSHFTTMSAHEKSIAQGMKYFNSLGMERASTAPRMPESDNSLAFQTDSFANSLMASLSESQKDISTAHSISQNLTLLRFDC